MEAWPGHLIVSALQAGTDPERLASLIRLHGIASLLHRARVDGLPVPVAAAVRELAHFQALWEESHRRAVGLAISSLAERGVIPVLLKGTCLAYSDYDDPALRTRSDTDLLVPPGSRASVAAALAAAGFAQVADAGGDLASYQTSWSIPAADGTTHWLDVHWRINNSQLLARTFTYEELQARARPLPRLHPLAVGTEPADSLVIACMHRATHRHNPYTVEGVDEHDADRLIWLTDIDILARGLHDREWEDVIRRATAKGLAAVCLEALEASSRVFGTPVPHRARAELGAPGRNEREWQYLNGNAWDRFRGDWLALGSSGPRARWLRELVFPPAAYMHSRFGPGPLAWLYLRRALAGVYRRVARRTGP